MWNWKVIPRRYLVMGGGFTLALTLAVAGLGSGVGARSAADGLAARLDALERSTTAQLASLQGLFESMPPRAAKEYLVRTCEGQIGVYDGTGAVLYEILDIDVRTLPAADRAMLDAGIIVTGEAALRSLTEDYSS